jgi:signal peptidase II
MKKRLAIMLATALVVFGLDQLTKWWIVTNIPEGGRISVIDGIAQLRYTHNTGAAFGLFRDASGILSIISPIVIAGIVIAFVRLGHPSRLATFAAGLIVGGALGNLADRLRLGHVVDFIDVYGPHLDIGGTIYTFPVFNVGDSGITVGVILILATLLFGKDEQSPQPQPALDDQPSTPPSSSTPNHTHLAG